MTPETGQNIMCARRYIWLQRSRGRMTPETDSRAPRDPDERFWASTEPGPDDPGDRGLRPVPRSRRTASTEPGPDDPGDSRLPLIAPPVSSALLQRSRGRMTPETEYVLVTVPTI